MAKIDICGPKSALALVVSTLLGGCVSGSELPNAPGTGAAPATGGAAGEGTGASPSGGTAVGGGATGGASVGGAPTGGATTGGTTTGGATTGGTGGVATGGTSSGGTGGAVVACETGLVRCLSTCVDTKTDTAHCGACNNSCGAGSCADGVCTCAEGSSLCGGAACVDVTSDAEHCGESCTACAANETCEAGVCTCAAPFEPCPGGCVDTNSDAANCGACGAACDAGQGCSSGECIDTPCAPYETKTGGQIPIGTREAACIRVSAPSGYSGGICSNFGGRTLAINGTPITVTGSDCSFSNISAYADGYVYFDVGAGEFEWASLAVW